MKKKIALFAGLGGIGAVALLFFTSMASWSFYALIKEILGGTLESMGVADPTTQLLILTIVFLSIAAIIATLLGVGFNKLFKKFIS